MCRLALYAGDPAPLSTTLFDPPRSLAVQAREPREMLRGTINVDGTGIAWWRSGDDDPLRYVTAAPPWNDPNLAGLAGRLEGRLQLAAVRSATPGIPFGPANVAPFVHDGHAFAHNGWIDDYRGVVGRGLLERLPDDLHAALDAVSDSLTLFMTVLAAVRERGGDLPAGVGDALRSVARLARKHDTEAAMNVAITDGRTAVVTRASVHVERNSLYRLVDPGAFGGATVVASEPLDDDLDWEPVPPDHAVVVDRDGATTVPLGLGG